MDKHCSNCGVELEGEAPKCASCGTIQDTFVYKSRIAAAALAFFAGIFGGHRFFLGQWWGIFYLLFFWTYIPWVVGIIEGIVFLSTSQKNWNQKYNQGISAGSEKGTVVIVLACIFPAIAIVGILAAVALPAYQDYTIRAKLAESHVVAQSAMTVVEAYTYEHQKWPVSLDDLDVSHISGSDYVSSIEVDHGAVYIHIPQNLNISGSIVYVPTSSESGITWSCKESTVELKYLPQKCR